MGMQESGWWVDNARHELHHGSRTFPCDRDIEALCVWADHALLLSSDTDCVSLWDGDGLVRLARVGVYPQDMVLSDDIAVVCGGTDCRLHMITLPELEDRGFIMLPGMPERIAQQGSEAYVLTLLTEPEVHTQLVYASLATGALRTLLTLPGIPGAIAADRDGLWLGVSGQVLHLPFDTPQPDMIVRGVELPERIEVHAGGIVVTDGLREHSLWLQRDADNRKGALTLR